MDLGHAYVWPRPGDAGVDWVKVDATTGTAEPLFDAAKMRAAFAALPGLRADDVERCRTIVDWK